MSAAATDKFRKVARRFVTQVGSGGISDNTATTGPLATTTGLPTDTGVDITFDRVDIDGEATSSLEETVTGVVSGSNLTDMVRGQEGTAQAHSAGKVAENLWNAKTWNDAVDGVLVEHNQDGTHKETALDSMLAGAEAQGNIIYHNGTVWSQLSPGTNGQFLKTQGASANPTWADIQADGWIPDSNTYVYVSASSFKISGVDLTTRFTKGTRIKFTQTSAKYFVVVSSAFSTDTTVTVAVNTDYTIANAAISSPYYSYQLSPAGYPNWFTFSPTFGGFSSNPSGGMGMKYRIEGNTCYFKMHYTSDGTSNATTFTVTIPVAAAQSLYVVGQGFAKDGGSNVTPTYGHIETTATSATVDVRKALYQGTWTGSGAKNFWMGEPAVVEF